MSLTYPGDSSALSDIAGRDAFLEALHDQALRVRILEKEPEIWMTLLIWTADGKFDIMGSTEPETEKSKSRFVRAAAGGKKLIGSGEAKISDEI